MFEKMIRRYRNNMTPHVISYSIVFIIIIIAILAVSIIQNNESSFALAFQASMISRSFRKNSYYHYYYDHRYTTTVQFAQNQQQEQQSNPSAVFPMIPSIEQVRSKIIYVEFLLFS